MHDIHHKTHKTHPNHFFFLSLVLLGALIGFSILFQSNRSSASHAYENTVTLKLKLQGELPYRETVKVRIVLYKSQGKVKEYNDVTFISQQDKTFEGAISLDSIFDYGASYALYIKPHNYFGKIFCNSLINGATCTSPQFIFNKNGNVISLTNTVFNGGDIDPINGRVDAQDISNIAANLGKSDISSTDVNGDGVTNTVDYSLALYSQKNNVLDDPYSLEIPWAPTPTLTPPQATPTFPFPSTRPTLSPIAIVPGMCQTIPAPFSVRLCGSQKENIVATAGYGACQNIYASTRRCSAVYLKKQCSCPSNTICKCQLKDQSSQSITCTNGGSINIATCN